MTCPPPPPSPPVVGEQGQAESLSRMIASATPTCIDKLVVKHVAVSFQPATYPMEGRVCVLGGGGGGAQIL